MDIDVKPLASTAVARPATKAADEAAASVNSTLKAEIIGGTGDSAERARQ